MKRITFAFALCLLGSQAFSAGETIDQLSAGTTPTGSEAIPAFQGSNPAVKLTAQGIANTAQISLSPGCGTTSTTTPITPGVNGTAVIGAIDQPNILAGANPSILAGYCGGTEYLNNAANQITTISGAGVGSFTGGWYTDLCNINTGTQTITPGAGTIGGASTKVLAAGTAASPTCIRIISDAANSDYKIAFAGSTGGSGTVTSVSVTTANGVSGTVATATTTPAITLTLGAITPTTVNGLTITTSTGTLTVANGKTLTANNSLTLAGTDSTTMTFPATSATVAGLGIQQTFSAANTYSVSGAASTPAVLLNGSIFTGGTGTTNWPLLLVQPSGATSTAWSTNGTGIGVNLASGSFSNLIDLQLAGNSLFKVTINGDITNIRNINASGSIGALSNSGTFALGTVGDAIIGRGAAANVQLGGVNSATPTAQILSTQGSRAGTDTNVGGGNFTLTSGTGTGTGTVSTITFQAPVVVGSGTGAQTLTTAMILGGGTVSMPNLASSSAATTGTVCWTTGGNLTVDTTLSCLSSLEELKDIHGPIENATSLVNRLEPFWYAWKEGTNQRAGDTQDQPGFGAHQVAAIDSRLVSYSDDGKLLGVRYQQMTALLTASIKELTKRISKLEQHDHADNGTIDIGHPVDSFLH